MKTNELINKLKLKNICILAVLVIFLASCTEGDDDFGDLRVETEKSPINFSIDGMVSFELNKQTLEWYYKIDDNSKINIEDTSQLLLSVKNLMPIEITNLKFWIIGYNSPQKRKDEINFIYYKTLPTLASTVNLGAITNTYGNLGESLNDEYFDAELSGFEEFSNNEFAGLFNASVSFFKNDTVESGSTTGICQINYLGRVKFLPDDRNTFIEFSGIVAKNGNFFGDIETLQGTTSLINSDTAAFKAIDNKVSAIIIPEEFIQDSITRIDLNMSSFQSVN